MVDSMLLLRSPPKARPAVRYRRALAACSKGLAAAAAVLEGIRQQHPTGNLTLKRVRKRCLEIKCGERLEGKTPR